MDTKLTLNMLCKEGLRLFLSRNSSNSRYHVIRKLDEQKNPILIKHSFLLPQEYLKWSIDNVSDLFLEPAIKFLNFMVGHSIQEGSFPLISIDQPLKINVGYDSDKETYEGVVIQLYQTSSEIYTFEIVIDKVI